jgi:hypothetical protein
MTQAERIKIQLACANLRAIVSREVLLAETAYRPGGSELTVLWASEALASLSTMLTERGE